MTPSFVTYSRNVFIPLTNICRNKCGYCGFRRDITHPEAALLSPNEVTDILMRGARAGCSEALFTFGEHPCEVSGFNEWLRGFGYDDILDYLVYLCKQAISFGLLPHSNPGILEKHEFEKLKPYNASMGLMLETVGHVSAHNGCAGKLPQARIRTIQLAGELNIPFTTGLLLGIGETTNDRIRSLEVIRDLHLKYGHIQEVIIQNFIPKPGTQMASFTAPGIRDMIGTVTTARNILPQDVAIQVSPNLIDPKELIRCGASDLGGVSPETIDHINPECRWPKIPELQSMVDVPLRERLPIYPQYIRKKWYSDHIAPIVEGLSDAERFRKTY